MMEVDDHPIFIQFFPATGHFNDPVVPVKAGTFAFIRKPECMGTAHFHPFVTVYITFPPMRDPGHR